MSAYCKGTQIFKSFISLLLCWIAHSVGL